METRAARVRKDKLVEGRSKEGLGSLVPVGRASKESVSPMDLDKQGRIGKRGHEARSERAMGENWGNGSGEGNNSGESKRALLVDDDDEEPDAEAVRAMYYRRDWESLFSKEFGKFEDETEIPPKLFTDREHPYLLCLPGMQVFSVRLTEIKRGLVWPLQVYGQVALRDNRDFRRNLVFNRGRDDCQTLTAEDPYLLLTGPRRAVANWDPIPFEIELKVKGNTQREDRILSSFIYEFNSISQSSNFGKLQRETCPNKLSTVELTFAYLDNTVEATIEEVRVVKGSFGDFRPRFFACTNSLPRTPFVLIDPREGGTGIGETGMLKVTRSVVSVERSGRLKVTGEALSGVGKVAASRVKTFVPLERGRSTHEFDFGFSTVSVRIAWSQFT